MTLVWMTIVVNFIAVVCSVAYFAEALSCRNWRGVGFALFFYFANSAMFIFNALRVMTK